ncbi:MAG: aminodeoxychorismate synthase component I [Gammaproteobacteria bacterium]|nr:aminodeoxychorismate synthase component I [Gammaproteobacteria bacterium]
MVAEPLSLHPLPFDTDLLALRQLDPATYPCLLESGTSAPGLAGYDILFAGPQQELVLESTGQLRGSIRPSDTDETFLAAFDQWWLRESSPERLDGWPFQGGWLLYLGYELLHQIEPSVSRPGAPGEAPVATAVRVPAAVMRDRLRSECVIMAEAGQDELVAKIKTDVAALASRQPGCADRLDPGPMREEPVDKFLDGVGRIQGYIHEGDVFQVNLSRAWRWPRARLDSAGLYRALRQANPAPFAGLWSRAQHAIISSSPERLVEVRDGRIATRPIAGTRPRSALQDEDLSLQQELLAHPKERAEHVMLIDLERNDLGRVARPGSVVVNEFMAVESYTHVHHIVSNIHAQLRDDVRPGQVLSAVFPGGTITGCPKVRCMQIIAELEAEPRGAYTGALGYVCRNGDMDFNILIRSFELFRQQLTLRTGAGIVADSRPRHELAETRAKARGLLAALGLAG